MRKSAYRGITAFLADRVTTPKPPPKRRAAKKAA